MSDTSLSNIGTRIRERRDELGLSQRQVGELCGAAQTQVGEWERGAVEPRFGTVVALAKALRCTAVWLVFGDEKRREP